MNIQLTPTIKKILLSLAVILIAASAIFFLFFYNAKLIVNPQPSAARIELDGLEIPVAAKIKTKPGGHNLKITQSGYLDYQKDVKLGIAKTITLNITLRPVPQPEKLIKDKVDFVAISKDKNSLFYLFSGGKTLYKMDYPEDSAKRQIAAITPDALSDINKIIWSPDRLLAIFKIKGETAMYDFKRYDLLHQEIHGWGKDIGNLVWTPDGERIYYYYAPASGEKSLIKSDKTHTETERVHDLRSYGIENPLMDISADGKKIMLVSNGIYLFDTYTKDINALLVQQNVENAAFSPDGLKIVYTVGGELFIMDVSGENKDALGIKTAIAKTTWLDNNNLIVAEEQSAGDHFWKIDLTKNSKQGYQYQTIGSVDNNSLFITSDGKNIFFASSNNLYILKLDSGEY